MLIILLLAFALRAFRLDFQSLWSDEGISLQRAGQSLPELLAALPTEHTPGYFVLLAGWVQAAGESDFALRFLSLAPSVLAVALIFALGRALHTSRKYHLQEVPPPGSPSPQGAGVQAPDQPHSAALVAVTAALLLATGGLQVWYAQEARMYAWLLAMALVAMWAQWQLLERPQRNANGWAVAYALATAGVVYLHLYGALLPLAQAVFALGWLFVRRDGRAFGRWALASLGALLLFAPWLPHAWGIFGFTGWRAGGSAAELPWRYWLAYTVSDGLAAPWRAWLPWLYLLLLIGGAFYWWRTRRAAALYLLVLLLGPLAAVFGLALRNPDYHERYTIFLTAPLLLLAAGGIGLLDLRRYAAPARGRAGYAAVLPAVAVVALLVAGNGLALQRLYTDASLHKPDYRAAAALIEENLLPGDVILVDGPDPEKVFLHYYEGDAPVYAVGHLQEADYAAVGDELAPMLADAQRVWEVLYFHLPAAVQVWLATQGWATDPTEHNGIRVTLYGLADAEPVSRPLDVTFGPALTLQAVEISPPAPQAGDLLRVSTRWFVNEAAPEYKFSLRLSNAAGEPVYTVDYTPQNWFAPTNVWVVGQPAADQRGILLPPDLPAGDYRLTLRLYDPASGAAVESSAGQDVLLAELSVGAVQP
jgi:hypothetical protein